MKNIERKYRLQAFFLSMIAAVVAILPVVIYSEGFLIMYGDFNYQTIPFTYSTIEALHNGNIGWHWNTAMGLNFMGAYGGFLASPFYLVTSLFPESWSMYLLAPMLVLKIAFSGLFAHIYIRRFVARPQSALVGALLYAFSGYSLVNSVFYFFHETICFFPLLLIALEEAVVCKRRAVFALAVALCAAISYFFFIGECMFLVIYFLARLASDSRFRINVRDFFCLAFESVIGVVIAGVIFVPSIASVLTLSRTGQLINGSNLLVFDNSLTYLQIIKNIFLPPIPFSNHFFIESGETSWRSVSLFLPMFSIAGVVTFLFGAEKKNWIKRVLIICTVIASVPGLNSIFYLLNSEYYARWYYMFLLIMSLATGRALENERFSWKRGCIAALCGSLFFTLFYFFAPYQAGEKVGNETDGYDRVVVLKNMIQQKDLHWEQILFLAIAVMGAVTTIFLIRSRKKLSREKFMENAISLTVVFCMITGCVHFFVARLAGPALDSYNNSISRKYDFEDDEFFRVYSHMLINYNMVWGYPSTQCFNTFIPDSTSKFYKAIGDDEYEVSVDHGAFDYAFNALTRTKYIMADESFSSDQQKYFLNNGLATFTEKYDKVLRSDYVLPMACSYDTYCTLSDVKRALPMAGASGAETMLIQAIRDPNEEVPEEVEMNKTTNLMVHSVALKAEDIDKYSDILTHEVLDKLSLDIDQFKADVEDRQELSAEDFEITNTGFITHTNYDTDRILVVSTAFDEGWSAAANGVELEPHSANIGFLAVRVPAGEQEIKFTYTPPGKWLGIAFTIFGVIALSVYAVVIYLVLKKRPLKYVPIGEDDLPALHTEYMSGKDSFDGEDDV